MNWTRADTRALIGAAEDRPHMSIGAVKVIRRHHGEDRLVERMALFERFVAETNVTPHVWGESDCSLMVADWCIASGHDDPAAGLRGSYETEEQCRALVGRHGGLRALVTSCASHAGLKRLAEPEFGAVGVIGSETNADRQWSAIWNGHRWMVRWVGANGQPMWAPFVAKPLAMWRV